MAEYELLLEDEGREERHFPIPDEGLVIGRGAESEVRLDGALVSRQHARVYRKGNEVLVEDLGSRNGILVNGNKILSASLKRGDVITVGEYELKFDTFDAAASSRSVITYENATTLCDNILEEGPEGRLPLLYRTAQLLGTVFDIDELLAKILDLIFQAFPVKRGYILTLDNGRIPTVRATVSREGRGAAPPLSRTLVRHVISERNAILTDDAQDDARFSESHSVMDFAIQSAMCVPLCGRQDVVGAIYVDSGAELEPFSEEDLGLLTAIGQVAGVAVENATLYQERVQQERLAALGQATAGVGHCIKNILTGISGGAQIIDMALKDGDMKLLDKGWPLMRRAIDRMEDLVLNALTFAKDRTPELIPTDVNGLVRDVIETVRPRANKHNIILNFECEKLDLIFADTQMIFRVLLNLVTNSLDVCHKKGGTVDITTRHDPDGCYVKVKDNGPGIPESVRPTLFQAFVSTKGSSGTGLGLACCMKMVREHGGSITVESEPGEGAAFTVFLPAGDAPEIDDA